MVFLLVYVAREKKSVCLSLCEHDISSMLYPIFMKFSIHVYMINTRNNVDFGSIWFNVTRVTAN